MKEGEVSTIDDCQVVPLRWVQRDEGLLTMVEELRDIPFRMRRVYYIHNVPKGSERGFHAHKKLRQLMIAVHGSFRVKLNDGKRSIVYGLTKPTEGLLIVPGIWRELRGFSLDAVCLVIVSKAYDENDYIRDYQEFLKYKT